MKENVLFCWIPRCAGTSINKVLSKHNCLNLLFEKEYIKFKNHGLVTFGHVDINYLLKHKIIKEKYFNNAFKFCVVRNPWDRFVSLYYYLKFNEKLSFETFVSLVYREYQLQNSLWGSLIQPIYNILGKFDVSFIILNILNKRGISLPLPKLGPYNSRGLSQANNQTDWITDEKGNILVDYICKFENLENDCKKVFKIIGINEKLPHCNKSNHKNYKKYYNNETKRIVEEIYKKDVVMFEYSF